MNEQALLKKALELGFANAALVDTADVTFIPAFRPLCQENLCGNTASTMPVPRTAAQWNRCVKRSYTGGRPL